MGLFLKFTEGINATFFKPELSCTNQATWTIPVIVERYLDWRINAISVVSMFTPIAYEDRRLILGFPATLAYLKKRSARYPNKVTGAVMD